jgi:hypothetical protein
MVFLMTEPVVIGNLVMTIPADDLESAVRWVEASLDSANQLFRSRVLARRQLEAERLQQQQAAAQAELEAARERLRNLGG